MRSWRGGLVVIAGIGLLAALGMSSSALAAKPSTGSWFFDGVQVVPNCFSSPLGGLEFEFTVVNRRPTSVRGVRLDVYFRRGARLGMVPGDFGRASMRILGSHAWDTVDYLNVYSGFAVQPILHEDANSRTRSHPVTFTLTVEGARQASPAWVCTKR